jgi:tetratricopeptide (TPR) repeat protein
MLNRNYVHQRKVCVTGRLVTLTHAQLGELVEACGGTFIRFPTRSSIIVVLGDGGLPAAGDGTPSRVFSRARQLKARGYRIDFVSEDEFLEQIGLAASAREVRGLHTIADLASILEIPVARLRQWVHIGLIEPTETRFHRDYFDMQQVSLANRVAELMAGGTSLRAIRRGFEKLEAFLPGERSPLERIARMQRSGRILVRIDGRLVETSGQQHFDFDSADESAATVPGATYSTDQEVQDLLDKALDSEDAGDFAQTVTTYQRALQLAPHDVVLHYNLGNVLFALERSEEAATSYRHALEIDSDYVEAWNNLGNAYAEQQLWNDAAAALQNAIGLLPTYADAHFNLAEVCRRLDNPRQAAVHQAAYERHSSAARVHAQRKQILKVFHGDDEAVG